MNIAIKLLTFVALVTVFQVMSTIGLWYIFHAVNFSSLAGWQGIVARSAFVWTWILSGSDFLSKYPTYFGL